VSLYGQSTHGALHRGRLSKLPSAGECTVERKQQNVMFTQNYPHSWLQSTSVTTHGP